MLTTQQVLGGPVSIAVVALGRGRETGGTADKSQKTAEQLSCEATGPSTPVT